MDTTLFEFLKNVVPEGQCKTDEPMAAHTTFRVGGPASFFIDIKREDEIRKILTYLKKTERPYYIVGNGSNLLVGDKGYDGCILHLGKQFSEVKVEGTKVTAQAGALLSTVARQAASAGLTGMEFAAGIPGSIGGAIVMNAGAYDGEMKQIVESVTVLNEDGELMEIDVDSMEFGYRTSAIKNRKFVVVSTTLKLAEGNVSEINAKIDELAKKRKEKQPLEYPSAGSTFKRPKGYFAGKLIMDAGLRGFRIGGAQVSEKHCGFVVNIGNATAADVREVMDEVTERVKKQFHVTLEPEVIFLGDF
ncbi:MAG: UDP-N-acetylmuramate dehydrogenase [Lachnospiraceae bacterium]|nr:UDP-N-acetylmuramate dehydrogenase [Lachnospiraceae bacterium]